MQLIELSLDHHKLYCPISGEPILEPEDVNRDAPSLVAYWVDMAITEPYIKDDELRRAWEAWSATQDGWVDTDSFVSWLKGYDGGRNWVVFEIDHQTGPHSETNWVVLDLNASHSDHMPQGPGIFQEAALAAIHDAWNSGSRHILLQYPLSGGRWDLIERLIRDTLDMHESGKVILMTREQANVPMLRHQVSGRGLGGGYDLSDPKFGIPSEERVWVTDRVDFVWKDTLLIIMEDANDAARPLFAKFFKRSSSIPILGITEGPVRLDDYSISKRFEKLITSPALNEFSKAGAVNRIKFYTRWSNTWGRSRLPAHAGRGHQDDFSITETEGSSETDAEHVEVVDAYNRLAKGKKGVVHTVNLYHASVLQKAFASAGVNTVVIGKQHRPATTGTRLPHFKRALDAIRTGEADVIINAELLFEGHDEPEFDFVQIVRPTSSPARYLSMLAPVLRFAKGQTEPRDKVIIDHTGIYKRLGPFDQKWPWDQYFHGADPREVHGDGFGTDHHRKQLQRLRKRPEEFLEV